MTRKPLDRFVWERLFRKGHNLKGPHVAVAYTIASHINAQSGLTWPNRKTIAREAGVSEGTVYNALQLLDGVWITKVSQGTGRSSTRYALRLPSGSRSASGGDALEAVVRQEVTAYKENPQGPEVVPPSGATDPQKRGLGTLASTELPDQYLQDLLPQDIQSRWGTMTSEARATAIVQART